MPTQSTTYNSRVTDEALEKRFRDTFRSQGGAELVDDLYAQGVIVPVVDFTAAATGQQLGTDLQTAWDFTTGHTSVKGATQTIVSNSGFWLVDTTVTIIAGGTNYTFTVFIDSGITTKTIYALQSNSAGATQGTIGVNQEKFVVFLRAGDSLKATSSANDIPGDVVYRQIATVNGDLVNPFGFTSS